MDRIEAALTTLKSLLLGDETIIQGSHQLRLKALKHRREIVVATNMRLVIFIRRTFGGYRMHDIRWQDLQDAAIDENLLPGLFGAVLSLRLYNGTLVRIDGLEPVSARALYVYASSRNRNGGRRTASAAWRSVRGSASSACRVARAARLRRGCGHPGRRDAGNPGLRRALFRGLLRRDAWHGQPHDRRLTAHHRRDHGG